MRTAGVYIHIPFCVRKCGYCDFNAYSTYKAETKALYVDAVCREIAARAEPESRVPTIFFGGGTPTVLPASDLVRILNAVREHYRVDVDAEVTVEANPGDADRAYFETLLSGGVNRLSFGVQSFDDRLLRAIDRIHTADEARSAVATAKEAGFANISIDLMFALPEQTMEDWDRSLDEAFALDVPHFSMYSLILEERTAFHAWHRKGRIHLPGEDLEAAMFARAIERTCAAGYRRYEVSNYARPGFESRHNALYWRNEEYFGIGAGASSYIDGVRSVNERLPRRYAQTVLERGTATASDERLGPKETMGETIILGMRMTDGIDLDAFERRFGARIEDVWPEEVARLKNAGLLEMREGRMRLTERGLFLGSEVAMAFLP